MKITAFQMQAGGTPQDRLTRLEQAMRDAKAEGSDLLVAPELAISGYGRGAELRTLAQPKDGPWVQKLQQLVHDLGISLVTGFPEADGDRRYISAVIINSDEPNTPLIYRKYCLYGDYEKGIFDTPERSTILTNMHGLKLGFLICYDVEFPENARRLAQAGAQVIIVPTAMAEGPAGAFITQHVIPVRAFENQVFIVYANHTGADDSFGYQGMSSIVAPDGQKLAFAPQDKAALISAQIDPAGYEKSRSDNPYLSDRLKLDLTRP
ncbi:carbon-nitrogen hydrolase family protein [Ruegeria sp. HKCCA5426]|uniref:carbon-nitrogen hydrolase family protein n=1 Tax=Ruegeria sp. HKCCA5426 TaxID=2682985 RepID=UPI001488C71C|nr:carbon-nitrogen hydrolase family protein [Ruegeria sp. HKCCA5426]